MAVSSLTKFTVPLATNQSASNQGLLMPKLGYRFRVTFSNFGVNPTTTELTKQVMDCTRPQVSFGDLNIDVYNSKVKLLGKPDWQDITINLRDDAGNEVSRLVSQQVQKQFDFMEQASAAAGIDYKFITKLEVLDGSQGAEAGILETWEMYGCFLQQVAYGEMNYANAEAVKIALTVRYDNAMQVAGGTGIGTYVGERIAGSLAKGARIITG
jgi:hypothetical protein